MLTARLGDAPSSSSDVRSPTRTSSDVRSPTSTSTEVRSPTSTSTEVRSPTSTSTDAYTAGNVTVTGGAGAGANTYVIIHPAPRSKWQARADERAHRIRSEGAAGRMQSMIRAVMAQRAPSPMPAIMQSTSAPRAEVPLRGVELPSYAKLGIVVLSLAGGFLGARHYLRR